ncbi:hypothetical protein HU230_0011265 [Bradyrhizobium quebecense]|uniref:Uncharacterized protein n=1 Tax=Bradyrhizobium quebecense TaxID=2748629 RepID=A0A973WPH3_9BRAD|nr:hypothetical protein [Bradyrhizobium quebecense]UGA46575.1 hypothetical protein HU230_0011265 [Bradyrhizobium quebecense]
MTSMETGFPERGSTPVALLRAHTVSRVHDRFDRELQVLDAAPRVLDLRFQDLWAGNIRFRQILMLDQRLGANFVRDCQVAVRRAALDDGLEALQIGRHVHRSSSRAGDRDANRNDAEFAPRHSRCHAGLQGRPCGKRRRRRL